MEESAVCPICGTDIDPDDIFIDNVSGLVYYECSECHFEGYYLNDE